MIMRPSVPKIAPSTIATVLCDVPDEPPFDAEELSVEGEEPAEGEEPFEEEESPDGEEPAPDCVGPGVEAVIISVEVEVKVIVPALSSNVVKLRK